jgi:hypothetical protein
VLTAGTTVVAAVIATFAARTVVATLTTRLALAALRLYVTFGFGKECAH